MPATLTQTSFLAQEHELKILHKIAELESLYRIRQNAIIAQLSSIWLSEDKELELRKELARIKEELRQLTAEMRKWVDEAVDTSYNAGIAIFIAAMLFYGLEFKGDQDSRFHSQSRKILRDLSYLNLSTINLSILRSTRDILGNVQLLALQRKQILNQIQAGALAGASPEAVGAQIEALLRDRIGHGRFVPYRDGRQVTMGYYARMYAQGAMQRYMVNGTINACIVNGIDLVRISYHDHIDRPNDNCPLYAGKIYSIAGADSGYPLLTAINTPGYHPHCKHYVIPVPKGTL